MQPIAHPVDVNAQHRRLFPAAMVRVETENAIGVAAMEKVKISSAKLLLMAVLLLLFSGCVSLVYYEGDYHGKVIDAETLQPIEGAVVLGVWSKGYHGAGGIAHEYYDARETVTDKNGEFTIKGMGPRAVTHLEKMDIVIFKVGYEEVGHTSWESLKTRSTIEIA